MSYQPPIDDILFTVSHVAGLANLQQLPGFEDANLETVETILLENAKFCSEVIAPLNFTSDQHPGSWINGIVKTSSGFKEAYQQYIAAGWQGLHHPVEFGGQGLPKLVAAACTEMLNAASLSFALCPLLTDGAIEALLTAGNPEQQQHYLPHLIQGNWSGTMNLTEPQAGSDLSAVRTRAILQEDGSYRLFGQKIFITYGEHDLTENIAHLVLARTPNAPEGIQGISLFLVPKFLVDLKGNLGKRNDVFCASIEHKLGIKASPTAVMLYGSNHGEVGEGAIATLVGQENRGLEYTFIMMNAARFAVGMQGIAIAERAYQMALNYAKTRIQSRPLNAEKNSSTLTIIHHPDVKRLLISMRSQIEAMRSLAYVAASIFDQAKHHAPQETQIYEYLVPIIKGWCTEAAVDITSSAIQVFGGMGYIEETGIAQLYRDAKILSIYEGTTAIQANDLVGRKTIRNQGTTAKQLISQIQLTIQELLAINDNSKSNKHLNSHFSLIGKRLQQATLDFENVINFIITNSSTQIEEIYAGSVLYLKMAGIVLGGWQLARAALLSYQQINTSSNPSFYNNKIISARFFADHFLTQSSGMRIAIIEGGQATLEFAA